MPRILFAAIAAAMMSSAAPAAAQVYDPGYRPGAGFMPSDRDFIGRLERIDQRVRTLADQGRISRREAGRLLRELGRIDRLSDDYRRDGLTPWERGDLRRRLADLHQRADFASAEGRRWDGRGWEDERSRDRETWEDDRWDDGGPEDDRWDDEGPEDRGDYQARELDAADEGPGLDDLDIGDEDPGAVEDEGYDAGEPDAGDGEGR